MDAPRTLHAAAAVDGVHTELVVTAYENRYLVVATQLGKLGTLLHAHRDTAPDGTLTYRVDTLLGRRDDPLLQAAARRLADLAAAAGAPLPIVLSLGLKPGTSPGALRTIVGLAAEQLKELAKPPLA